MPVEGTLLGVKIIDQEGLDFRECVRPQSSVRLSLATAPQQGGPLYPQGLHHGCILEPMPFEQSRIGRSEVAVRRIFQLRIALHEGWRGLEVFRIGPVTPVKVLLN